MWTRVSAAATLYKTFSAGSHRVGETVLNLDLGEYEIVPREGGVSILASADQIGVDRLVSAIDAASTDPRISALVVRGTGGVSGVGLACLGEIRDAVRRFSSAWGGKPAILHVPEGIGGVGNGTIPMYFASAFDSVHLQPTSDLLLPGLSFGSYFFKKLLDSLGVSTKVVARKEYKNAANSLTEERFTGPQRESTEVLLQSMMSTITAAIAAGRGLKIEEVEAAIDKAFMDAKAAEEVGLVDEACFRDEFPEVVRRKIADVRSRRAENRHEIEKEWRDAMEGLREVWHTHQRETSVWSGTTWMSEISHAPFAGSIALEMCNTLVEEATIAVKAELRALKAHLAWLDSCPWEQYKTFNEKSGSAFYQVPHAFSVLELERRLCADGIKALERFPQIVAEMLEDAKGAGVEALRKKASEKKCYRWVRSMARAKTLSARMYDSLQDFVEDEENRVAQERDQNEKNGSVESIPTLETYAHVPRSFLLGDAVPDSREEEEVIDEDETKPAEEEGKRLILAAAPKHVRKEQKPHLHYVRLIDYMDLISRESRAATRQSRWGFFGWRESFSYLKDGLVDVDEVRNLLRLRDSQLPFFQTWRMAKARGAPLVAVIHIDGVIDDASAESIRSAIRRADKDFRIKAIVLRIDSPGGSAVASDIISRAVDVAKKPVVSSMGNICASGGYYIAAPSNKILCDPGTITGSIGVILQAFNTASLFEKAGVSVDRVDHGRFAKYFGPAGLSLDWDPDFLGCINKQIDKMYETFVGIVAKGRGMNYNSAERIARGRVWAGNDALRLGLIDQYGGLRDALDIAAELAELGPDSEVRPVQYPSKAMLAEERLRKAGVLPSRIDEEGDEVVPTSPQRKRRWPVFSRRAGPEPDEDDEDGDKGVADDGVMSHIVGHMAESRLTHYVARCLLTLADDYLMKDHAFAAPSRFIEAALDALYRTSGKHSAVKALAQQAEVLQATAGRPATVAPEFFIDD